MAGYMAGPGPRASQGDKAGGAAGMVTPVRDPRGPGGAGSGHRVSNGRADAAEEADDDIDGGGGERGDGERPQPAPCVGNCLRIKALMEQGSQAYSSGAVAVGRLKQTQGSQPQGTPRIRGGAGR